jgi:hypothetical protein
VIGPARRILTAVGHAGSTCWAVARRDGPTGFLAGSSRRYRCAEHGRTRTASEAPDRSPCSLARRPPAGSSRATRLVAIPTRSRGGVGLGSVNPAHPMDGGSAAGPIPRFPPEVGKIPHWCNPFCSGSLGFVLPTRLSSRPAPRRHDPSERCDHFHPDDRGSVRAVLAPRANGGGSFARIPASRPTPWVCFADFDAVNETCWLCFVAVAGPIRRSKPPFWQILGLFCAFRGPYRPDLAANTATLGSFARRRRCHLAARWGDRTEPRYPCDNGFEHAPTD